jgi:hypothetical protein
VDAASKEAFAAMAKGDTLRTLLAASKRWLKSTPADLVSARRTLAADVVAKKKYIFDLV